MLAVCWSLELSSRLHLLGYISKVAFMFTPDSCQHLVKSQGKLGICFNMLHPLLSDPSLLSHLQPMPV